MRKNDAGEEGVVYATSMLNVSIDAKIIGSKQVNSCINFKEICNEDTLILKKCIGYEFFELNLKTLSR